MTLADRHIYSTFQPLLYQVATAGLAPSDVAYPLRGFARKHGARFLHGELARIDTAAQVAWFADGRQAGYDYLILATGVTAAFYGITRRGRLQPRSLHAARRDHPARAPDDRAGAAQPERGPGNVR